VGVEALRLCAIAIVQHAIAVTGYNVTLSAAATRQREQQQTKSDKGANTLQYQRQQ
jgi:hypothetical protein